MLRKYPGMLTPVRKGGREVENNFYGNISHSRLLSQALAFQVSKEASKPEAKGSEVNIHKHTCTGENILKHSERRYYHEIYIHQHLLLPQQGHGDKRQLIFCESSVMEDERDMPNNTTVMHHR